jgi:hypothetical protein
MRPRTHAAVIGGGENGGLFVGLTDEDMDYLNPCPACWLVTCFVVKGGLRDYRRNR